MSGQNLIKEVNALCEHAFKHLPRGYVLSLVVCDGEASVELEDWNGNNIEWYAEEQSCWESACDAAKDDAEQKKEPAT